MAEFVKIQGMFRIEDQNILKDYACADQTRVKGDQLWRKRDYYVRAFESLPARWTTMPARVRRCIPREFSSCNVCVCVCVCVCVRVCVCVCMCVCEREREIERDKTHKKTQRVFLLVCMCVCM